MDRDAIGPLGEVEARRYFEEAGWNVLGQNIRFRTGELDLVVERFQPRPNGWIRVVVFVEVKTRRHRAGIRPATNVTSTKRRKIVSLAKIFLRQHRIRGARCRFDVVGILWDQGPVQLRHVVAAFDALGRPR